MSEQDNNGPRPRNPSQQPKAFPESRTIVGVAPQAPAPQAVGTGNPAGAAPAKQAATIIAGSGSPLAAAAGPMAAATPAKQAATIIAGSGLSPAAPAAGAGPGGTALPPSAATIMAVPQPAPATAVSSTSPGKKKENTGAPNTWDTFEPQTGNGTNGANGSSGLLNTGNSGGGTGGATGTHSAAPPQPGVRINQYELIKMIGEGGMGTVFAARDLRLGRRVAIKFLQSNQAELTQRFLVEARVTAGCQHENIVVIYEVGEHAAAPFMVLEFLNGKPLTAQTEGGQRLPYARAVEIMCFVLRALQCAHEQGIVHRDLKPDNIFITDSGTVKVLDFGIAKVLQAQTGPASPTSAAQVRMPSPLEMATGSNTGLTRVGTIMGTLKYMSPEQWGIGIEIDHLTDIWACGVLLHRLICGRHPLHPLDGNQLVVTAMLELPMPSMQEAAPPDVPRELIQIVDRCLLKLKEQRWQSAGELLKALEPFLPGRRSTQMLAVDETPYAGLSSFQENDAGKFFGRNKEIAAMVTRIRDRPLMAVVGSSGVGKSSFIRAGLVPALKRSGEVWDTLVIRPGRSPMQALAGMIGQMSSTSTNLADDIGEQKKIVATLSAQPGHLGTVLRGRARRDNKRLLIFVDQFEELYTQVPDAAERAAFTACLNAIADDATSPLRVVVSIRADFLDRVSEDQAFLAELTQGLFFLGPPSRDGLRDAIVQPAEMASYRFESNAIVEDMLNHLEATPGALPLLQFTAAKLWEVRDTARKMLTQANYAAMGGVAGALASHADRVVADLGPSQQALTRSIWLRLVTPERTRAIVPIDELRELSREVGSVQRLVDHMVSARLLVVQTLEGGKGTTVEIVHESLVHGWPTLRRWLDENQEDAAIVDQLRTAAKQWQAKGRDAGLLWRGDTAEEAKKFRKRYKGALSDVEQAFLAMVVDQEVSAARKRRAFVVGGFVALGLLVAAAMVALVLIQKSRIAAKHQAVIAEQAEQQATAAKQAAEKDRVTAVAALKDAQEKERQRLLAEAEAKTAETKVAVTSEKLDKSQENLKQTNAELKNALGEARKSEERSRLAAKRAEENAAAAKRAQSEALVAKEEALKAKSQTEVLLKKEQERAERLQKTIGSKIVDTLN